MKDKKKKLPVLKKKPLDLASSGNKIKQNESKSIQNKVELTMAQKFMNKSKNNK